MRFKLIEKNSLSSIVGTGTDDPRAMSGASFAAHCLSRQVAWPFPQARHAFGAGGTVAGACDPAIPLATFAGEQDKEAVR
ncbi:MAG: hypothetical protein AB7S41_02805 [Parvibaculaceae bacterium]